MQFPSLNEMSVSQDTTETFIGLDRNMRIAQGAMNDMENLTSDYYPMLASRDRRSIHTDLREPNGIIAKDKLMWVDGSRLYYDGQDISDNLRDKGASISNPQKVMVSMGAYVIIMPDKVYVNTADLTDCGRIEATDTNENEAVISMCLDDGTEYNYTASPTEPANPEAGQRWIDTSGEKDQLKIYGSDGQWVSVDTPFCKISCEGIGRYFKEDDGVDISGCEAADLNGSKVLQKVTADSIIIIGMVRSQTTQAAHTVRISRTMPDMDFIIECQNRLWGCKYGTVNGKQINEIYCCALGDFKNWNRYKGISTDSYTASVGTDGAWTGAITHMGYPLFWKENHLHKVYVEATGGHQIIDTQCRGVQAGCEKSLAIVDEKLFFKSRDGVCYYDGAMPTMVSTQLGTESFGNAVAGSIDSKYYISMEDSKHDWHLFCLDVRRGIWIREDSTRAYAMVRLRDELYCLDEKTGIILGLRGKSGSTKEDKVKWSATTGIIGYADVRQKYVSRFLIRMKLEDGASAQFMIEYDSNGKWLPCGSIVGNGIRSAVLPIRPVRCDHFRIRVAGEGEMRTFSMSRVYERGSDVCGY